MYYPGSWRLPINTQVPLSSSVRASDYIIIHLLITQDSSVLKNYYLVNYLQALNLASKSISYAILNFLSDNRHCT